ncbi:Ldh family oxidoreductase [Enterobacter asburiae]
MSLRIEIEHALQLVNHLLIRNGCDVDIANDIAEHLTQADRFGFPSHGLALLPKYIDNIVRGDVTVNARPKLLVRENHLLRFHAHNGFGQHAVKVAIQKAIAQTRNYGFCLLTLCHAHHLGRLGHYGKMVSDQELAMLAMSNVTGRPPLVAPWGGAEARMATNPFCFAWPLKNKRPSILVDFATSSMAYNNARVMYTDGKQALPGQLIDAMGNPSVEPGVLFGTPAGALLPFGEHKGFGISLMIEMMAGILSDGNTIAEDHPIDGSAHNHLFALLINPKKFSTHAEKKGLLFIDYLMSSRPQVTEKPVVYPGMHTSITGVYNERKITISKNIWSWLVVNCPKKNSQTNTSTPIYINIVCKECACYQSCKTVMI